MAKAGFWLRGATGKLAGSALQKGADGSTIIREIVQPTNPKTESQKIQRIVMTTVMQAYSHMKAITDHSFEGVTAGAATMSTFMRYNLNMLRQKVATGIEAGEDIETMYHFCPTGAKMFAPNDYIISAGSLPGIGVVYSSNIPGNVVSNAFAGIELPANTYRSLIETYDLRRGDQITLISVQGQRQSELKFYFARIILDPTNADGSQASLDSPLVADGAINLPSPRNEGEFAGLIYDNGKLFYSFVANQWVSTAGVIVSRKYNNKWLRSNCTMKANEDVVLLDEYSLGYCLSNFNATEINTLSNRMLNNAGTGRVVQDGGASPAITTFVLNGKSLTKGGTIDVQVTQNARVPLFVQAANLDPNAQYGVYGFDEYDTPVQNLGGQLVNGVLQVLIDAIAVGTHSFPIKLVKGTNLNYEVIEDYGTVNWTRTE